MTVLSDDEYTVLMIANEGESMMPIGRWEKPVQTLVAKGFLHANDKFNNVITQAGRDACGERSKDDDRALTHALGRTQLAHKIVQPLALSIVDQLVNLAEATSQATGERPEEAARKWSETILNEALAKLKPR